MTPNKNWDRVILYLIIPLAFILVIFRESPRQYGFSLGDWKAGLAIWDLRSFFPAFGGPETLAFKERLRADVSALQERAAGAGGLDAATAERWEGIVLSLEDIEARLGHITAYVECLGAADAGNESYSREEALLAQIGAEVEKAEVDLLHVLKAASAEDFAAFAGRDRLRDADHWLRRLLRRPLRTMTREQERLAADLAVVRPARLGQDVQHAQRQASSITAI